jgi:hypothetical protein
MGAFPEVARDAVRVLRSPARAALKPERRDRSGDILVADSEILEFKRHISNTTEGPRTHFYSPLLFYGTLSAAGMPPLLLLAIAAFGLK